MVFLNINRYSVWVFTLSIWLKLNFASKPFSAQFPPNLKGHNIFIYRLTSIIFDILRVNIMFFLYIRKILYLCSNFLSKWGWTLLLGHWQGIFSPTLKGYNCLIYWVMSMLLGILRVTIMAFLIIGRYSVCTFTLSNNCGWTFLFCRRRQIFSQLEIVMNNLFIVLHIWFLVY